MRVVLRVDDAGWVSADTPDPGLRLAQRFHAALGGLPYLAGIIPACVDSDGLAWLQSRPAGLLAALHGWDHAYSEDGCANEFRMCDLAQCRERLERGKAALADIDVHHMILPFNAYAPDLSEACYLAGIRHIWGGGNHCMTSPSPWPTPPQSYPLGRVGFVPSWAPTYAATLWRMGAEDIPLRETLPKILDSPGKAVLTLHITWESAKCDNFQGVRWLVGQIQDRVITADEYLA